VINLIKPCKPFIAEARELLQDMEASRSESEPGDSDTLGPSFALRTIILAACSAWSLSASPI
jgi:hypothetical protein